MRFFGLRNIRVFNNSLACPAWTKGRISNGFLHPGESPGHGVDLDEKLAAKYPYQRAYLPVNRLEDGTMWNW